MMEFKRNFNKKVKTEPENLSEVMYNINNNMHAITKKHDEDVNDFVSTDIGSFKHIYLRLWALYHIIMITIYYEYLPSILNV